MLSAASRPATLSSFVDAPPSKYVYTRPNGTAVIPARQSRSAPPAMWSFDLPTQRDRTPPSFLFWARLAAYHDPILHNLFLPTSGEPIPPPLYICPACLSKSFREVLVDPTPATGHLYLHNNVTNLRSIPGQPGPPLPPGFCSDFLEDPKLLLTSFPKGKLWSSSIPTSAADLQRAFHPFYFLLTLPNCTSPRLAFHLLWRRAISAPPIPPRFALFTWAPKSCRRCSVASYSRFHHVHGGFLIGLTFFETGTCYRLI